MTGTFPCVQEAKASYKCMDDNNYDRDACLEYFKSYKECKKRMVSGMGGGEGQGVEEVLSSLYVHTPMHTRVVKNHICTCVYVRTYVSVVSNWFVQL